MHNKVPYHLITKAVVGYLNSSDEAILNDWLCASPKHLAIFQQLESILDLSQKYNPDVNFDAESAYKSFSDRHLQSGDSSQLSYLKTDEHDDTLGEIDQEIWDLAKNYTVPLEFDGNAAYQSFTEKKLQTNDSKEDKIWDLASSYDSNVSFDSSKAMNSFFDKYEIHKEELGVDEQIWNLSKSYSPDIHFDSQSAAQTFLHKINGNIGAVDSESVITESELDQLISNYTPGITFDPNAAARSFLIKYGEELRGTPATSMQEAKVIRMKPGNFVLRIAASFAILIASFFAWNSLSQVEMVIMNGPNEFVLSDATKVFLNDNSTLTYPEKFGADKREVTLDGEGYFDVSRNPDKPFSIGVGDVNVNVLGTAFEVTEIDNDFVIISVDEGKVEVDVEGKVETLTKDQRATANLKTGEIDKSVIASPDHAAWKDSGISFIDIPLSDVLVKLEEFYGISFQTQLSAESLNRKVVSHNIKNDSFEYNLLAISKICDVNFTKVSPGVYRVTDKVTSKK